MLINIPWYVRWGFDVSLFVVPYYLLCSKINFFNLKKYNIRRCKEEKFLFDDQNSIFIKSVKKNYEIKKIF
jgi:hypothetical protein